LIFCGDGGQSFIHELLDALAAVGFGRIDVALGIRRDAVHAVEFAGLAAAFAESGQDFERLPVEDVNAIVLAVGEINVLLLGIFRKRDVPGRARASVSFSMNISLT